ncbi:GNAT family N-acetyltransferase [Acinetobacter qingfengensis]|uniref:N-acetyltransferase domain-containing protein n=1 Tax=Acinetobacter qingfengensis TaxID=1262585 RepID=A0A1E7QWJ1_9GAMM|nr:GNAT family N-acetyltransferase [Acinetobacter qingfengensis]KAA8731275.1 GNAT family N-acetyltransferase [Acinetobacter qingfengensis]OEY91478.1 hypothetical protein BJI46_07015 [Acinetobacter qingfengensis]
MDVKIDLATSQHCAEIVQLVNQAYRPQDAAQSWTNEAGLVTGKRTSTAQILALLKEHSYILLMYQGEQLLACVHIEKYENKACIGMLTTHIDFQNQGIGKVMLQKAEEFIRQQIAINWIEMAVLSKRPELIAFYQRRGYQLTCQILDYPVHADIGVPLSKDLKVLQLYKKLCG